MQLISDFFVALLTTYLIFTNNLADKIANMLPAEPEVEVDALEETEDTASFSLLPSSITGAIPNILLRSTEYQSAALGSAAGLTGRTATNVLDAVVNIYCTFSTDAYVRTTTGTGFFIDPDGVIMTNAHVAQFLLLEEADEYNDTECIVRTGNPAAPAYTAELLYIPPAWIQDNASMLNASSPVGTGERDYALLYAAARIDNEPLPAAFPSLSVDTSLLPISIKSDAVVAAGYPATNLIKNGPTAELIPEQADTSVSELYTFGSNHADVIAIRGSSVGAEGASGGPVVNTAGEVIGMIVTRGDDTIDGVGSLRAITLSHVERTLEQETGFNLLQNSSGDLPYRAEIFKKTMTPFLLTLLTTAEPE